MFRPHFGEGKPQVALVWETMQIDHCIELLNTIQTISLFRWYSQWWQDHLHLILATAFLCTHTWRMQSYPEWGCLVQYVLARQNQSTVVGRRVYIFFFSMCEAMCMSWARLIWHEQHFARSSIFIVMVVFAFSSTWPSNFSFSSQDD